MSSATTGVRRLAWAIAAFIPDRVDHLVALSVGHPSAFGAVGFEQRQKSWYFLFFQFEDIAEQWLSADDFANMRDVGPPSRHGSDGIDLARPGALTAALNWYRANVHPRTWLEPALVFPQVAGADDGRVEQRRLRAGRAGHDGLAAVRRRHVAVRADRRTPATGCSSKHPIRSSALLLDFLPKP